MSKPATLEAILDICSFLQTGPVLRKDFSQMLLANDLTIDEIEQITGALLIDIKENMVYLTDKGKEWVCHLGYLFGRNPLSALLEFYRKEKEHRIVSDACGFIMNFIERLPQLDSFWICSPWIVIAEERRSRFKKCLEKVKRIQIITRPPRSTTPDKFRKSVEDSLTWLYKQGVEKISLHESVHAKAYLLEESVNSWRNRVLVLGSENLTFSDNPELSLCIYDDRLFRDVRSRLASLITPTRFKSD